MNKSQLATGVGVYGDLVYFCLHKQAPKWTMMSAVANSVTTILCPSVFRYSGGNVRENLVWFNKSGNRWQPIWQPLATVATGLFSSVFLPYLLYIYIYIYLYILATLVYNEG